MRPSSYTISFGPGPPTRAIRALIVLNVAGFLGTELVGLLDPQSGQLVAAGLGLFPALVVGRWWIWQPLTYMFLHGGMFHLLFNMLALWMFGVELERLWGTRFFVRYYLVCGVGAALTTVLLSLLPFAFAAGLYGAVTVGASGAVYGLLLAYGLTYPNRIIYLIIFPLPAKAFVIIVGAIALYSSVGSAGGVAHATHLGGLVVGYVYLMWTGSQLTSTLRSRWLRWRMARLRRKFDVHQGGRPGGPDRWVH